MSTYIRLIRLERENPDDSFDDVCEQFFEEEGYCVEPAKTVFSKLWKTHRIARYDGYSTIAGAEKSVGRSAPALVLDEHVPPGVKVTGTLDEIVKLFDEARFPEEIDGSKYTPEIISRAIIRELCYTYSALEELFPILDPRKDK